uniref:ATP synthase complex subunit 8 n=1 Tax=Trapezodirus sp. 1 EF-2015 TaxID=1756866 RepID=A0A0S2M9B6_9COLE|nr:ATP synthase F0 subunit 8 [Trapezodirus sp. 1 EF-2015]
MPQMAPMNWLILFFMFLMILMMFNSLNFFSFFYFKKINLFKNKKIQKINWKW